MRLSGLAVETRSPTHGASGLNEANSTPRQNALERTGARDGKAPFHAIDLVRRDTDGQVEPARVIASAHDLGVFVEPMQSLPIAGVERQFEFRTPASQTILDSTQKMVDPL